MNTAVSISARHLSVGYGTKVVQPDLSFDLHKGEMVCMLGRNGCGKSTLLRTLAKLQPPLSGTFHIDDVAVVLTDRLSLENTTIREVVAMGRYPYTSFLGTLTDEDQRIIDNAMEATGCKQKNAMFNALSDGEKQRVLIAKALAQQTPVILLDEPTAHLDLPNRILILKLLRTLAHDRNKTILISTHELELALRLADRILLMSENGAELDTADNLRQRDAFTRAFGMNIFDLDI